MKIKKFIYVCTQHVDEVKKAIEYNKKCNWAYLIYDETNLIGREGFFLLKNYGYDCHEFGEGTIYVHKNYNYEKEKIEGDAN